MAEHREQLEAAVVDRALRPGTSCAASCETSFGPTHRRALVTAFSPGASVNDGPIAWMPWTWPEVVRPKRAAWSFCGIQAVQKWCCSSAIQPPVTVLSSGPDRKSGVEGKRGSVRVGD